MIDLYCRTVHELQLLDIGSTSNIVECHFWGNGVACMTTDNSIRVAEVSSLSYSYFLRLVILFHINRAWRQMI